MQQGSRLPELFVLIAKVYMYSLTAFTLLHGWKIVMLLVKFLNLSQNRLK